MNTVIKRTGLLVAIFVHVAMAANTRYTWIKAWTDSCNGLSLQYNAISTFRGMGKWRMEQRQNGEWVEVGTPSFDKCDASSQWQWVGVPSGKLHVTEGANENCMKGHFDEPDGDKYDILVRPSGSGKQQRYKAPDGTLGELVTTPGVKVTINK